MRTWSMTAWRAALTGAITRISTRSDLTGGKDRLVRGQANARPDPQSRRARFVLIVPSGHLYTEAPSARS